MKSLIWKECRESLKWAALAMLLFGGAMYIALKERPFDSIMNGGVFQYTILGGAVFGATLGFLQIFSESRGDRRSLLLHRPLSHSQIFLGKALAGVGLYLLALGIPFACAVAWAATPGQVAAPFRWPMVLPGLADILTGVVYYFAGMLTAQREARWYGSRGLSMAAAVLCSFLVQGLPEFSHALLAIAVLGGLMAVAAWGSFMTGGAYAPQPRIAKTALAIISLAGLLLVGVLLQLAIAGWFDPRAGYSYELDRQGRILIVRKEAGELSVTDLDGHEAQDLKGNRLDHNAIQEIQAPLASLGNNPEAHWYRHYDRLFLPIPSRTKHAELWFYVADQARLLGYDRDTKRLIGSFGPDGFVPGDHQPGERFEGALYYRWGYFVAGLPSPDFLPFSRGVYTVNFKERTIQPFFIPAAGQTMLRAARKEDDKKKQPLTWVLTENAVLGVDHAGLPVFSAPLAYDLKDYRLQVGQLDDAQRFVTWYEPSERWEGEPLGVGRLTVLLLSHFAFQYLPSIGDQTEHRPHYLVEYDAGGRETNVRTVPPLPAAEPGYPKALHGLVTPLAASVPYRGAYDYYFTPRGGLTSGMNGGFLAPFTALMLLSAVACALGCFLLARRYAFSRTRWLGWSLCGLLWGPSGLLLMVALQEWPARVRCPKCRKPRVVTRDTCEHCAPRTPRTRRTARKYLKKPPQSCKCVDDGLHLPLAAKRSLRRERQI